MGPHSLLGLASFTELSRVPACWACIRSSHLFVAKWYSIALVYPVHKGWFHSSAIMNNAVMNIHVQILCGHVFISLVYVDTVLGVELPVHRVILYLTIWGSAFPSSCSILHAASMHEGPTFLANTCFHLFLWLEPPERVWSAISLGFDRCFPTSGESSCGPTSSLASGSVGVTGFDHSRRCVVAPHCCFTFFARAWWHSMWSFFSYAYLPEVSAKVFGPFFN